MSGRVVVVGGGISGLATAYFLNKSAPELSITVVEKDERLGGKIQTERAQGCVIEAGPDAMLTQKPWALDLCKALGLEGQLISPLPGRKTFVLQGGRMRRLPRGAMGFIPSDFLGFLTSDLFSLAGKLRMGLEPFVPPKRDDGDESLGGFVRRRLGDESLERLAEPLLAGVYAADADRLSLEATFPTLRALEREHGNLIRGALAFRRKAKAKGPKAPMFTSLETGLGTLVDSLEAALVGVQIVCGQRAVSLERLADDAYALELGSGQRLEADHVVLTTPAFAAAELLAPLSPAAAEQLGAIPYASTAVVTLGFERRAVAHPLDATGFLVPRTEGRALTACTWSSSKWPGRAPEHLALLRCFFGKRGVSDALALDDDALVGLASEELRELVGAQGAPLLARVHRWPRAMPQYEVGHLARLERIERALDPFPSLHLVGAGYRGIGLPDCVKGARDAAGRVLRSLREGDAVCA